ncbi:MAG TPA: hypothetical protein VGA00_15505 [Acidiferrobacterales bacterium]|jgi:hypothetical protein
MQHWIGSKQSLVERVNGLVSLAEDEHPGLEEVAAMVYVGDVYVLREQSAPGRSDGWGDHAYLSDALGPL